MNVENVKKIIDAFLEIEAEAHYKRLKPDMTSYNKAYEKMHSYTIGAMTGTLGLTRIAKLNSEDFYLRYTEIEPFNPRHLYKISHYAHKEYGDVWIAYTSGVNPDLRVKLLSNALFFIQTDDNIKLARKYSYSNNRGMNPTFDWEGHQGIQDLTMQSLGELISINRYSEPLDYQDSLKLYLEKK